MGIFLFSYRRERQHAGISRTDVSIRGQRDVQSRRDVVHVDRRQRLGRRHQLRRDALLRR